MPSCCTGPRLSCLLPASAGAGLPVGSSRGLSGASPSHPWVLETNNKQKKIQQAQEGLGVSPGPRRMPGEALSSDGTAEAAFLGRDTDSSGSLCPQGRKMEEAHGTVSWSPKGNRRCLLMLHGPWGSELKRPRAWAGCTRTLDWADSPSPPLPVHSRCPAPLSCLPPSPLSEARGPSCSLQGG